MDESEAYWGGLAVAMVMLGSGFSLLLFPNFTGYGAVILSLGIMTMIIVLMTKALIIQIQKWMDYNARIEETVANILALKQMGIPAQAKTAAKPEPKKKEIQEEEIAA
jgi:hypothetical protein